MLRQRDRSLLLSLIAILFGMLSSLSAGESIHPKDSPDGALPPLLKEMEEWAAETIEAPVPSEEQAFNESKKKQNYLVAHFKKHFLDQIFLVGQRSYLHRVLNEIMNRLARPLDRKEWTVKLSFSPLPNAWVFDDEHNNELVLSIGFLGVINSKDFLAGVIGHEMTHKNKDHFKAKADSYEVMQFLKTLKSYNELDARQQEEIRADIGAMDRLISGGFNPWAFFYIEQKMAKIYEKFLKKKKRRSSYGQIFGKDYYSTHPKAELRMEIAKAYIHFRSQREDLSKLTVKNESLGSRWLPMSSLGKMISAPVLNGLIRTHIRWTWYYFLTKIGYHLSYDLWHKISWSPWVLKTIDLADRAAGFFLIGPSYAVIKSVKGAYDLLGAIIAQPFIYFDWSTKILDFPTNHPEIYLYVAFPLAALIAGGIAHSLRSIGIYSYQRRLIRWLSFIERNTHLSKQVYKDSHLLIRKLRTLHWMNVINNGFDLSQNILSGAPWDRFLAKRLAIRHLVKTVNQWESMSPDAQATIANAVLQFFKGTNAWKIFRNKTIRNLVSDILDISPSPEFKPKNYDAPSTSPSTAIHLLRKMEDETYRNDPQLQIELINQLSDHGFIKEARKVAQYRIRRLWIYAINNSGIDSKILNDLFSSFLTIRLMKDSDEPQKATAVSHFDSKMALLGFSLENLPFLKKLLFYSFTRNLRQNHAQRSPSKSWRHLADLYLFNRRTQKQLFQFLSKNVSSIEDLVRVSETTIKDHKIRLPNLSIDFHKFILSHPELIRSPNDIDLLFKTSYLWPSYNQNLQLTKLEAPFEESLAQLIKRSPNIWTYNPSTSEQLQNLILSKLNHFSLLPKTNGDKIKLWNQMTDRGVTPLTDQFFREIAQTAGPSEKHLLEKGISESRIWDQDLKFIWANQLLDEHPDYHFLLNPDHRSIRKAKVQSLVQEIQNLYPERGYYYQQILEKISVSIQSTADESAWIESQKDMTGGQKQQDITIRSISEILSLILEWKKEDQWAFLSFLVFDGTPSAIIRESFKNIGTSRIKALFNILPTSVRASLLDSFLNSPSGLLSTVNIKSGYSKMIVERLLSFASDEDKKIAVEILEGFLYSLSATGNEPLQSLVISYLLSFPKKKHGRVSHIIRDILELFGTTGVKIGQFIVASGLFKNEEDQIILRQLQDHTREPIRESIYEDLRVITNGKKPPVELGSLKGAASIKFVIEAFGNDRNHPIVLKFLRLDALTNTNSQFIQLNAMAEYLKETYGARYGIFRSIVTASQRAVQKEILLKDEIARSRLAQEFIYRINPATPDITYVVPKSILVDQRRYQRLIAEEFARGVSVFDLEPNDRTKIAESILELESDNLFSNQDLIIFDPDRHPGNFRILKFNENGQSKFTIAPIDFGQLTQITSIQRDQVIKLFTLAQFLNKIGPLSKITQEVEAVLNIKLPNMAKFISPYFSNGKMSEVTAYFALLAALEDAGFPQDSVFFDFIKGIVQLENYERLGISASAKSPRRKLEDLVKSQAVTYKSQLKLNFIDSIQVAKHQLKNASYSDGTKKGFIQSCLRLIRRIL